MLLCRHKVVLNLEEADVLITANSVYKNSIIYSYSRACYICFSFFIQLLLGISHKNYRDFLIFFSLSPKKLKWIKTTKTEISCKT